MDKPRCEGCGCKPVSGCVVGDLYKRAGRCKSCLSRRLRDFGLTIEEFVDGQMSLGMLCEEYERERINPGDGRPVGHPAEREPADDAAAGG